MIRGNVVKTSPTDEKNLYFNSPNLLNNYLISGLARVGQIVRVLNIQGGYDLKVIINNGSGGLTTRDLIDKSRLQETQAVNDAPTTSTTGKAGDIVEVDGVLYECFGQKNNEYIWKKVSFGGGAIFSGDTTVTPNITPEKQLENAIKAGDITPGMLVSLLEDGKYKNYIIQTITQNTGACTKTQSGGSYKVVETINGVVNADTDYFVGTAVDGYKYYRYINGSPTLIGSNSYTKAEVDTIINAIPKYYYYHTYGTATVRINNEDVTSDYFLRLWRCTNEGDIGKTDDDETIGTVEMISYSIVEGGSGSGTGGIALSNVVKPSSIRNGQPAIFSFNATSSTDAAIMVNWYVDGALVETETYKDSGSTFSFNAQNYVRASDTSVVKASIISDDNVTLNKQWNITSTAFSISWGQTIQPITLYTENINPSIVVNVTAQANQRNNITLEINGHILTETLLGTGSVTFNTNNSWYDTGANIVTATMSSSTDSSDSTDPISFVAVWGVGLNNPVAVFGDDSITVSQYDIAYINYLLYDPTETLNQGTINIDNQVFQPTPSVQMQTLEYSPQVYGTSTATITLGSSSDTLTLSITQSEYNIGKITGGNLSYDLEPLGHHNSDADREDFANLTFSNNFDWDNGGFKNDTDGAAAFVVKKGNKVTLPRCIFEDIDGNGKTIDISFRVKNSDTYDALVMSELNNGENQGIVLKANEGELRLRNTSGQTFRYCEEDRIDLSINVEKINDHRVMTIWLDGIPALVNTYDNGALVQNENSLEIGSLNCDVWIYAIRVYNTELTFKQMIQNYISLAPTTLTKIQRCKDNSVYNSSEVITIEDLHRAAPNLTIVHIEADAFPIGKDDSNYIPTQVTIIDGSTSLVLPSSGTRFKVQGTSSVGYINSSANMDINFDGTDLTYKISENSIPVNYLNIKVNVASSENANNVCAADWYNTYQPYLVPGRSIPGVRDTIEGKPCVVFFTNSNNSSSIWAGSQLVAPHKTVLYAAGDLCNSKNNLEVFAQDGQGEHPSRGCIEVSGNNTDAQQFRSTSTYNIPKKRWESEIINDQGEVEIVKDFEWRAKPASSDLDNVVNSWNAAVAWVVSTIGNSTKFKNEVSNYFAIQSLLYHFLYLEFFAGLDNVSKNTFYSLEWDEEEQKYLWNICKNYDDDTILGCDNDGKPLVDYGIEYGDLINGRSPFNAVANTIWTNIKAAYGSELDSLYQTLKGRGAWSANNLIAKWDNYQNLRPHAIMAQDAYNKYILPYKTAGVRVGDNEIDYDDDYLPRLQGSKIYQRHQFLTYQTQYMDGKHASFSKTTSISFRPNNDNTTEDLTIKSYAKTYVILGSDTNVSTPQKVEAGQTVTFSNVSLHSNTTTYIAPEGLVQSIVPLYNSNNNTFSAAGAKKLTDVILGSANTENTAWRANDSLSLISLPMLKNLSIRNMINYSQSLNLSNNTELETVDARGTKAGIITLPSYAPLTDVYLNSCSGILAKNLNKVENFSLESGNNLTSVNIENCNNVVNNAILTYLNEAVSAGGTATRRIRLINVNWSLQNGTLLKNLLTWGGYSDFSLEFPINNPVITGTVFIARINRNDLSLLEEAYPSLIISTGQIIEQYQISFKKTENNVDVDLLDEPLYIDAGTLLSDYIEVDDNKAYWLLNDLGERERKLFDAPTLTPTWNYLSIIKNSPNDWDRSLSVTVNSNLTFYAQFDSIVRSYRLKFIDNLGRTCQLTDAIAVNSGVAFNRGIAAYIPENYIENSVPYLIKGWSTSGHTVYEDGDKVYGLTDTIILNATFLNPVISQYPSNKVTTIELKAIYNPCQLPTIYDDQGNIIPSPTRAQVYDYFQNNGYKYVYSNGVDPETGDPDPGAFTLEELYAICVSDNYDTYLAPHDMAKFVLPSSNSTIGGNETVEVTSGSSTIKVGSYQQGKDSFEIEVLGFNVYEKALSGFEGIGGAEYFDVSGNYYSEQILDAFTGVGVRPTALTGKPAGLYINVGVDSENATSRGTGKVYYWDGNQLETEPGTQSPKVISDYFAHVVWGWRFSDDNGVLGQVLRATHNMNNSNITDNGWGDDTAETNRKCNMNSWMNDGNNSLFGMLPNELQSIITPVKVLSQKGRKVVDGTATFDEDTIVSSESKLFLLSRTELWGAGTSNKYRKEINPWASLVTSRDSYNNPNVVKAYRYPGVSDTRKRKYSYYVNGTTQTKTNQYWWLRSPGSTTGFCNVSNGGFTNNPAGTSNGVSPAFCVG